MSTINRDIAKTFGKAAVDNTISSTGTITTTGGGISVSVNTTVTDEGDVATADTTGLEDGQLVFFPALNKCYFYNTENTGLAKFSESQMLAAGAQFARSFVYFIGGYGPSPTAQSTVDRVPISADGSAADQGDLSSAGYEIAGYESETAGYVSGNAFGDQDRIKKWTYASNSSGGGVANLAVTKYRHSAQTSPTHGYTAGGWPNRNHIDKFNFSTEGNASDVGDLTTTKSSVAGAMSATHGYASGGRDNPGTTTYNVIDKFPFAADDNATDIGDLGQAVHGQCGFSSDTHGFKTGGLRAPGPALNVTYKIAFASDGNSTTGVSMGVAGQFKAGAQSHFKGYFGGGDPRGPTYSDDIYKYNFGSSESVADIGSLTSRRYGAGGVSN